MSNDERIIELKAKIAESKKKIENSRFAPVTSCVIDFYGQKNLNVLTIDQLKILYCQLKMIDDMSKDEFGTSVQISNYSVCDWLCDIKSKITSVNAKNEREKLAAMERKLDGLLSNDKKTELEIDEIANMLG